MNRARMNRAFVPLLALSLLGSLACSKPHAGSSGKEKVREQDAGLQGPLQDQELASEVAKLLPEDWKARKNVDTGAMETLKPAVLEFWTWRPDESTELLVGTVVHDATTLGKPKGDLNNDYGGLVVVRRTDGKAMLLLARKTGEAPPTVTAGKGHTVAYRFHQMCGALSGTLSFSGGKVEVDEKRCEDLGRE